MKKKIINKILLITLILSVSSIFIYFFSYTTSILYPDTYGYDSSIFQLVGKGWLNWKIPYKELFDHKGCLIYFFDLIGYFIAGRSGIMLLQIIALSMVILFSYKSYRLFLDARKSILLTFLELCYYAYLFDEGNMTEEWSLPFLVVTFYIFIKYLKNFYETKEVIFNWKYGLLFGLSFGAITMLRMTNAISIFLLIFIILILLIKNKQYKNIIENILSFIIGFLIITIPFAIYFASKNALYDSIYGTILFNISYFSGAKFDFKNFAHFMLSYAYILVFLLILSLICIIKGNRKLYGCAGILNSIIFIIYFYKTKCFPHYAMILVPLFILFPPLIKELENIIEKPVKYVARAIYIIFIINVIILSFVFSVNFVKTNKEYRMAGKKNREAVTEAIKLIPEIERNSVTSIIENNMQFFLINDIFPKNKFYFYQVALGNRVYGEFLEDLNNEKPKWIITQNVALNYELSEYLKKQYNVESTIDMSSDIHDIVKKQFLLLKLKE